MKHVPNGRREQNSSKRTKQSGKGNIPDAECKILVMRMLSELMKIVDELSENFNKEVGNVNMEIENIKNNQSKMKTTLYGINSRVDEVEDQISNMEDKEAENTQSQYHKEKEFLKNENSLRSPWDDFKHTNIHIMGMPEGEKKRPRN